jgi:hypothetical protein
MNSIETIHSKMKHQQLFRLLDKAGYSLGMRTLVDNRNHRLWQHKNVIYRSGKEFKELKEKIGHYHPTD